MPPPSYWERKNQEVALLRGYLGDGNGAPIETGPDLLREKLQLRARMIARFIERHPFLTESNLSADRGLDLDGSSLGFNYQRYDMTLAKKPFAPWIYPTLTSPRICSLGFLAASGMSAVTTVLTSLDLSLSPGRKLYMAPDTYYETRQFALNYLYQLKTESALPDLLHYRGVLLLDSISGDDPLAWLGARDLAPLAAVLLDTTCYDVSAPEIERVVERCRSDGVPCVLIRSHLKIDTLGLEYGRLGSIVIVLPRPCDRSRAALVRWLRSRIVDLLVKTGTGFSIHAYFPLTSDGEFRRLNGQRNAAMKENNLRATAALCDAVHPRSATRIRSYHHGRFFFLQPAVDDPSGRVAVALAQALLEAGAHTRLAPSFGYDFVSITRMRGAQYRSMGGLRVSLPDFSPELIDRCIDAIARFAIDLAPTSGATSSDRPT